MRVASGEEAAKLLAALPVWPVSDAFALTLTNADARRVGFDDPTGVIRQSFGAEGGWIVGGDEVTAELTLTEQEDPETAFIATMYEQYGLADRVKEDGSGYSVTVPVGEDGYDLVMGYPGAETANHSQLRSDMVFAGEAGADAFIEMIRSYGYDADWHYDGSEDAGEETGAASAYIVNLVDQNGDPVPGGYVNFCTDDTCQIAKADENGVITFEGEPNVYHVQVVKVPEGYSFDKDLEAYTGETPGEMTIEITRD